MPTYPDRPSVEDIINDLRKLRERGFARLRHDDVLCLRRFAETTDVETEPGGPGIVEALLRAALQHLSGPLGAAAAATFGLAPGTRDRPAPVRRRHAAVAYQVSQDHFRKYCEKIVIDQVAEEILKLGPMPAPTTVPGGQADNRGQDFGDQIVLLGRVGLAEVRLTVHVESVELLNDIDIIVVPANVYFEPPQQFKSSVFAAVRRAAAIKNQDGQIVDDVITDELHSWLSKHGRPGLPVAPGTVAPTSSGALANRGIRRIYHMAVTSPVPGTNDYYVEPTAITIGVRNVLDMARAERLLDGPPLGSVGFPLLGAGRGRLSVPTSFARIWSSLEADIKQHEPWEIHFVTRHLPNADFITRQLRRAGFASDRDDPDAEL